MCLRSSFNCKLVFSIIDKERVVELQEDIQHEADHEDGAPNGLESQAAVKERRMEQPAFRRIRYFRETRKYRKNQYLSGPGSDSDDDDADYYGN